VKETKGMKIYYKESPSSTWEYHSEIILHVEDATHLYVGRMGSWGYWVNQHLIAVGTSTLVKQGEINCPVCRGAKDFAPTHEVDMSVVDTGSGLRILRGSAR